MRRSLLILATAVILIVIPATMISSNALKSSNPILPESEPIGGLVSFDVAATRISFEDLRDLAKEDRLELFLPTHMPSQMQLKAIYRSEGNIMLCYSNIEVESHRYANVTIEIRKVYGTIPSVEDLNQIASADPDGDTQVMSIDGTWVVIVEKAHWGYADLEQLYGPSPLAYFWRSGNYYMISVTPPITSGQLIDIIRSLTPLAG